MEATISRLHAYMQAHLACRPIHISPPNDSGIGCWVLIAFESGEMSEG
jgi:hypothetical protein